MNTSRRSRLLVVVLLAVGLVMTVVIRWSQDVYCGRYFCVGRLEQVLNLALPWLSIGFLAFAFWLWQRRPRGGLAFISLLLAGCLALIWGLQVYNYYDWHSLNKISLANALAEAAPPPSGLTPDWDGPAILPLGSYLLVPPDALINDYVTFRLANEPAVRGGLAFNLIDYPPVAELVFERLIEQLPAGQLVNDGQQIAGQQAFSFSQGKEQHLAFLRCRAIVYLWTVDVSEADVAVFATLLDHWLIDVACNR